MISLFDMPLLDAIRAVLLILLAIVMHTFVALYSRRQWRKNPYGRALMYSKMSLALILDVSIVRVFYPEWTYLPLLGAIIFFLVFVTQTRMLFLLFGTKGTADDKAERAAENV